MTQADIIEAITPVIEIFDRLSINYYIGGSVASSAYGFPRSTLDVDLVADLVPDHVNPIYQELKGAYYINKDSVEKAVCTQGSFNIIHLDTILKIDIFTLKRQPYDLNIFQRIQKESLDAAGPKHPFVLAPPEDVVLHKLLWYRDGGMVSERQWSDVIGVLKVQSDFLDLSYMKSWAEKIDVRKLLDKALDEVEIDMN